MALYFTLTPRIDPGHGPMALQHIDEGICAFFNKPVHPKLYYNWWYDAIGFWLSCGESWERIRHRHIHWLGESIKDGEEITIRSSLEIIAITHWLEENYIVNAWYGR